MSGIEPVVLVTKVPIIARNSSTVELTPMQLRISGCTNFSLSILYKINVISTKSPRKITAQK